MRTSPSRQPLAAALAAAIERAVAQMVPSVICDVQHVPDPVHPTLEGGSTVDVDGVRCWGGDDGGGWTATISRPGVPLTSTEVELLALLPEAIASLQAMGAAVDGALPSGDVLEEALVVMVLHRRNDGRMSRRAITTILGAVRQLSFCRYEGHPATSGLVAVADVDAYIAEMDADPHVVFDPLSTPLRFDHAFFDEPASHRYVDGRHCFYVVGPDLAVHGLVRVGGDVGATDPLRGGDDLLHMALGRHVDQVLGHASPGWCVSVDANSTVNVFGREGLHLRWGTYHWRMLDRTHLPSRFRAAGMSPRDADILAGSLTSLSDSRQGTLLLVPTGDRTPQVAGVIDTSPPGAALTTHLVGRSIQQLRDERTLLGILSCDGMTIVSRDGKLLMTGAIIDLHDLVDARSGGGRTHAAASAAQSGLTAMVSSDGQITLYEDGHPVLHLQR